MKGLDGSPKMSKRLMNYFTLQDKPEAIRQRISNAFTGGRATVEEQRKLGGTPEICPVHDLCLFHFVEDDQEVIKMYNDCRAGKLLCGEHKARTIEKVLKYVQVHKRKKAKFIDKAKEILHVE
jgi:tryptophanyl-tRNA synthetase